MLFCKKLESFVQNTFFELSQIPTQNYKVHEGSSTIVVFCTSTNQLYKFQTTELSLLEINFYGQF